MTKEHRTIQVETTVEILMKSEKNFLNYNELNSYFVKKKKMKINKILNRARKNYLSPAIIFFSEV